MSTKIFYFSTTGNSLAFARQIAAGLGDTELISIPTILNQAAFAEADRIGFIFPVYAWGLPRIVAEFIKKLNFRKDQYIFAIATCGGTFNGTLLELRRLLKQQNGHLNAGFAVKSPGHALLSQQNSMINFIRSLSGAIPGSDQERLNKILSIIQKRETHRIERGAWLGTVLSNRLHPVAISSFKNSDKDYWVDQKCTGCGTCTHICPRQNITLEDGKPVWHHDCELCFGCIQWCPSQAIQYQTGSEAASRSHHPDINLVDMIIK